MRLIFSIDYNYNIYNHSKIHQLTSKEIEEIKNDIYHRITIQDNKKDKYNKN